MVEDIVLEPDSNEPGIIFVDPLEQRKIIHVRMSPARHEAQARKRKKALHKYFAQSFAHESEHLALGKVADSAASRSLDSFIRSHGERYTRGGTGDEVYYVIDLGQILDYKMRRLHR